MVDMAVGIIIGAAFGTVVRSIVDDIVTPIVSALFEMPDFTNLFIVLKGSGTGPYETIEAAREAGAVVLGYGLFMNAMIAFLMVGAVLFFVVKAMNVVQRQADEAAAEPAPELEPPKEVRLLTEIRDLLAARG